MKKNKIDLSSWSFVNNSHCQGNQDDVRREIRVKIIISNWLKQQYLPLSMV